MINQDIAVEKSQRLPNINAQLNVSYLGNGLTDRLQFHQHLRATFFTPRYQFCLGGKSSSICWRVALNAGEKLADLQKEKVERGIDISREQLSFRELGQYLDLDKIDNRVQMYEHNIVLSTKI